MSRIVVCDATPLHYLVLIDIAEVLPTLYGEVLIPQTVSEELLRPGTPEPVRRWMEHPPVWVQIISPAGLPPLQLFVDLDQGEYDAIRLALNLKANLVLMDDREGVEQARRLGLTVTGTIGVLDRAAEHGFVDLSSAFDRLRQTNFRIDPAVLRRVLIADAERRKT